MGTSSHAYLGVADWAVLGLRAVGPSFPRCYSTGADVIQWRSKRSFSFFFHYDYFHIILIKNIFRISFNLFHGVHIPIILAGIE